jgi:phosphoribosyl 1,2-cyclic phosphodiesterase
MADDFTIRFWGVRGSIACGGSDYAVYGGNTSCLEVRCGGQLIIFDAGTGLRPLGDAIMKDAKGAKMVSIFLTHTHFDHICGLPFFQPLFDPDRSFDIWSGHLAPPLTTRDAVSTLMSAPVLPIDPGIFKSDVHFRDFRAGETQSPLPGVVLKSAAINHPNGATGYRIEYAGHSACYITDVEHTSEQPCADLLSFVTGTDILIYDSSYTDAEYAERRGYGHSTWRAGLALAKAAGAKLFVPFHHDPSHTDATMAGIEREAREAAAIARVPTVAAREGMVLDAMTATASQT